MNTLVIEILACLAAAALISLVIGWLIRGSKARRELKANNARWESKHSELELRYKQDTAHLEDQVQSLTSDNEKAQNRNESISESLRENEISVHKARADAIELNRQQADTQERLQRIIAQKDEELKLFRAGGVAPVIGGDESAVSTESGHGDPGLTEAKIASLSAKREAWERERQRLINDMSEDQATVAIDPADLPGEPYDQTVRISPEQQNEIQSRNRARDTSASDADHTQTLDDDQTIALDPKNQRRPGNNSGSTEDDKSD